MALGRLTHNNNALAEAKRRLVIYKVQWIPTGHTYTGKSQGNLSKRINAGHVSGLVAFLNLRDKYSKNIAKESALIAEIPEGRTTSRFSFSTVVTPECSQIARTHPNTNRII